MVIYTSGTTGLPKGTVHVHGGFPLKAAQDLAHTFDLRRGDALCWFTDLGWMMGPWAISGALLLGARLVMYEGAPDWPDAGRLWSLVARHRITHFGLSPTLIRALRIHGETPVRDHDLGSLRVIGSTGEPWNPDPWRWCFEVVGGGRLPIVNYSGGTEIGGGIVGCSLLRPIRPTSFNGPCIGMAADIVDASGQSVRGAVGELAIRAPWPGMTRGFWAEPDDDRYLETYWRRQPGLWIHGDWAATDGDGYWYIHGRSDDTLKVAGKRVGPAEVEACAVAHPAVAAAAAIGVPDELKGEAIVVLCVPRPGVDLGRDARRRGRRARRPRPRQAGPPEGGGRRPRPAPDPERQGHASGRPGRLAGRRSGRHVRAREPGLRRSDRAAGPVKPAGITGPVAVRSAPGALRLLYLAIGTWSAALAPFTAVILRSNGLDTVTIGLLSALAALAATALVPAWGHLADVLVGRVYAFELGVALASGAAVALLLPLPLAVLAPILASFALFPAMFLALGNALAVGALPAPERQYGALRALASLSFAVGVIVAGILYDRTGYSAAPVVVLAWSGVLSLLLTRVPDRTRDPAVRATATDPGGSGAAGGSGRSAGRSPYSRDCGPSWGSWPSPTRACSEPPSSSGSGSSSSAGNRPTSPCPSVSPRSRRSRGSSWPAGSAGGPGCVG